MSKKLIDKQWFRNYSVQIKDEPAKIAALEEMITRVQNENNLSRTAATKRIFEAGVNILNTDPKYASTSVARNLAFARLYDQAKAKANEKKQFSMIYKELGPEAIQDVAKEVGIEIDELNEYRLPFSHFEGMKNWISQHLDDGEAHHIDETRERAIVVGILPNPEKNQELFERDWKSFKTAASELGVSGGRRGWWQKVRD